jgi:hypothetical protein
MTAREGDRDPEIMRKVREGSERLARLEALGQRAVACKGFRWMAGMLGLSDHSSSRSIWIRVVDPPQDDTSECWPDFSDPATLGCLLALVREAWGTESWHTRLGVDGWEVRDTYITEVDGKPSAIVCGMDWKSRGGAIDPNGSYGSEAEALVAALEAAQ